MSPRLSVKSELGFGLGTDHVLSSVANQTSLQRFITQQVGFDVALYIFAIETTLYTPVRKIIAILWNVCSVLKYLICLISRVYTVWYRLSNIPLIILSPCLDTFKVRQLGFSRYFILCLDTSMRCTDWGFPRNSFRCINWAFPDISRNGCYTLCFDTSFERCIGWNLPDIFQNFVWCLPPVSFDTP